MILGGRESEAAVALEVMTSQYVDVIASVMESLQLVNLFVIAFACFNAVVSCYPATAASLSRPPTVASWLPVLIYTVLPLP